MKNDALEGLRGVAALFVVIFHTRLYFYPESFPSLNELNISNILFSGIIDGGLAVCLFWVLSAYVLSIGFFYTKNNKVDYLLKSVSKRYIRLAIPVLVSVLLVYVFLSLDTPPIRELLTETNLVDKSVVYKFWNFEPSIFTAIKSSLVDTFLNYDGSNSYNKVLWTIKPEFLGSMFVFLFLFLLHITNFRIASAFLVMVAVFLAWKNSYIYMCFIIGIFFSLIDNLNTSISSKILKLEQKLYNRYVILLVISIGLFTVSWPFDSGRYGQWAEMIFAAFLVRLTFYNYVWKSLLSNNIIVFLGKISFGLYLCHVLFIAYPVSMIALKYQLYNSPMYGFFLFSTSILLSVFVGYIFTILVDKPSQLLSNKFGKVVLENYLRVKLQLNFKEK